MSDFVFSTKNVSKNKITKEIQSIYHEDKPLVKEYHGDWGSLGISENLYRGFQPYENKEFIVVVIGGPVLMFRDNSFLNDINSTEGTKAIYQRWKTEEICWHNDLSGPFVILIINKMTSKVTCITDLMSFIPVYYSLGENNGICISTHIDVLAEITNHSEMIDPVSKVDFILHGVVTFPYTSYRNIFQADPASEHIVIQGLDDVSSTNYWLPMEQYEYKSINKAAQELRNSLQGYINRITEETTNIAQFISGGEDSRTLSAFLQEHTRNAYIFLDQMNREGKIAKKATEIYGAKFKLAKRSKLHYLNILPSCSDLVGSGSQYNHAHTYGFHKTFKLNTYSAVFGGLLADALLKGSHIKRISRSGKLPLFPELKDKGYNQINSINNNVFKEEVLNKLKTRRKEHLNYIKSFRNESADEWFELWPSSMNMNISNIHANRRLFRSYEPFTSNEVVKISAKTPQSWKLNRRLFHKMAKPLLIRSKGLMHGDGWYPYHPWYINSFVIPLTRISRFIKSKLGIQKGNQGPWLEWNALMSTTRWRQVVDEHGDLDNLLSILKNDNISPIELFYNDNFNNVQRISLMQVIFKKGRNNKTKK